MRALHSRQPGFSGSHCSASRLLLKQRLITQEPQPSRLAGRFPRQRTSPRGMSKVCALENIQCKSAGGVAIADLSDNLGCQPSHLCGITSHHVPTMSHRHVPLPPAPVMASFAISHCHRHRSWPALPYPDACHVPARAMTRCTDDPRSHQRPAMSIQAVESSRPCSRHAFVEPQGRRRRFQQ